jgi:hypothetical protein
MLLCRKRLVIGPFMRHATEEHVGRFDDGAEILAALTAAAVERVLVLDGAMGTEIRVSASRRISSAAPGSPAASTI